MALKDALNGTEHCSDIVTFSVGSHKKSSIILSWESLIPTHPSVNSSRVRNDNKDRLYRFVASAGWPTIAFGIDRPETFGEVTVLVIGWYSSQSLREYK